LLLQKGPFLGMNGLCVNVTDHGGTAYGFGKEATEAAPQGKDPGRMPEAISHTGGLEASPKLPVVPLAGVPLAVAAAGDDGVVDDLCLWRLLGGAV
jgi:hypothetical protein